MSVTTRTNVATNPTAASTTNYAALAGTGGVAALTNSTSGGAFGTDYNRVTWSTATTAVSGGATYTEPSGIAASTAYAIQVWVRSSIAQTVQLKADFRDSTNTIVNTLTGSSVSLTAGTWTKLTVVGYSGAAVTNVVLTAQAVSGGVVWSVNSTFDIDGVLLEAPPVARTNLVVNPSFETNTNAWMPDAGTPTLTSDNSITAVSGTYSCKAVSTVSSSDIAIRTTITLSASTTYTFSYYVYSPNACTASFDASGTGLSITGQGPMSVSANTWTRVSATFTTSSTAPGSTIFYLHMKGLPTAVGTTVWYDAALLEVAGAAGAYFDGSTAQSSTSLYCWTGASNASTSVALTTPFTYFDGSFTNAGGVVYAWTGTANTSTSTAKTYVPYITLSQGMSPSPNVVVTYQDFDPGTNVINVWRTVNGKRRAVRNARRRNVVGSDFVTDYEAPLGVQASYDIEILSGVSAGTAVASATTTITGQTCGWVSDPLAPSSAVPVYGDVGPNGEPGLDFDSFAEFDYVAPLTQLYVAGSSEPVAFIGTRSEAANIALSVSTLATVQSAALRALIKQAAIILFRPLPGWASALPALCYLAAPTVKELPQTEKFGGQVVSWQFGPAAVVAPPSAPAVVPTITYGTVSGNYSTYAAFNAAHTGTTYLDVIKNP